MVKALTPSDLSKLKHILNMRWRARTNRLWFFNHILGYTLLNPIIHGPIIDKLQQFPKPTKKQAEDCDVILPNGKFEYTPWCDPYDLPGNRRTLILDHRSSMKTTANTVADTLYWLINFPHLAIAMVFATDKIAQDTMEETKGHLQSNQRFRELFPDLVPHRRPYDWGTKEDFTVEGRGELLARLKRPPRREPSVMSLSIDKGGTGYHVDVIKASDLVVPANSQTPGERSKVASRAGLLPRLLVVPTGWVYIEGTFYHPDDLHSRLVEDWETKLPSARTWDIFIRSIYKREMGGKAPTYTPADLKYREWAKEENGHEIPIWSDWKGAPSKIRDAFSWESCEKLRWDPIEGGINFAYQYLLDLKADESSDRPFSGPITWVDRSDFQKVPIARRFITVDLADTQNERSNPTVMTTSFVDRAGRVYINDIHRGKFTPEKTIDLLFELNKKYRPDKIFIEDYAYVHGLMPSIRRRSSLSNDYPPFHFVKRERKPNEKTNRIIRALQPPYRSGELRFVKPLLHYETCTLEVDCEECRQLVDRVKKEFEGVTAFSLGSSDDILDTLADIYLCREWWGQEGLREGAHLQELEAIKQLQKEQYEKSWKEMAFGPDSPKPSEYTW